MAFSDQNKTLKKNQEAGQHPTSGHWFLLEYYLMWTLGQFGETEPKYIPQIMSRDTQKVIQSFQYHISHWMRSYSSAKAIWGLSYTYFSLFGVLGQFVETLPSAVIVQKFSNFIVLTYGALNLLSRMGSIKNHFLLESGRFNIFETVMLSKTFHLNIFYFSCGQYEFLNFFSNFDDSFPSYD